MSHALLLSDLTLLASECKRKHPDVRVAAEAASSAFRTQPDAAMRAVASPGLAAENLILKPILLACDTKNGKVVPIALTLLQRVVGLKVLHESSITSVISTLSSLPAQRLDPDAHLKLLQSVQLLLSSCPSIHGEVLSECLLLCFRLQDSRIAVVSSTAAATLRQAVMTVFEKVSAEDAVLDGIKDGGEDAAAAAPLAAMTVNIPGSEAGSVTLFPCSKDAYLLLSDLNALAQGEEAPFLRLSSLPRTFTLELLESVLTNHSKLFRAQAPGHSAHPELSLILRQNTCPLLIRALSEKAVFPTALRLMRLLLLLLKQFSQELRVEVEILMSIVIRMVSPSDAANHPEWQRVLALELSRSLCADATLLNNVWSWYDGAKGGQSGSNVFARFADTLRKAAEAEPAAVGAGEGEGLRKSDGRASDERQSQDRGYASGLYDAAAGVANLLAPALGGDGGGPLLSVSAAPPMPFLDLLQRQDAPTAPHTYLYLLAHQSLTALTSSITVPILAAYTRSADSNSHPYAPPALDVAGLSELKAPVAMLQVASQPLLLSLAYFTSSRVDEQLFAEGLVALRSLGAACGAAGLVEPRDATLRKLAVFAVPPRVASMVSTERPKSNGPEPPSSPSKAKSGTGGGALDSGTFLLSSRNLACLKTYLALVHYLAGTLGPRWTDTVLTIYNAELVLRRASGQGARTAQVSLSSFSAPGHFSSSVSVEEGSDGSNPLLLQNLDARILQAHLDRTFEATVSLDSAQLLHFITALCKLVPKGGHIGAAKGSNVASAEAGKSYAVESIGLTATLNIVRLIESPPKAGWTLVAQSLLENVSDGAVRPARRLQVAEVLDTFIFTAMSTNAASGTANQSPERPRIQRQILDVLAQWSILSRRRSTAADVEIRRVGIELLRRILEAHGHAFVLGWETIFEICEAACDVGPPLEGSAEGDAPAARGSASTLVKSAFAPLSHLCSDLLSPLSLSQLELCVQALTAFSTQAADVNVALTATGTLWGVTSEMWTRWGTAAEGDVAEDAANARTRLWLQLLHSLLRIASDPRSDVRNGAIASLFRVLEQYGASLTPAVWSRILDEVLFPLLNTLRNTASSEAEAAEAKDGGDESKKRDAHAAIAGQPQSTPRQWDETRVLALNSTGRVIREYLLGKLMATDDFEALWRKMVTTLSSTFLEGPSTIKQASMRALEHILRVELPSSADDNLNARIDSAWDRAWEEWAAIGKALAENISKAQPFTQANLLAYVETLRPLYARRATAFTLEQVETLLSVFKSVVPYPTPGDHPPDVDYLTPLQTAVLGFVRELVVIPGVPSRVLMDWADLSCLAFTQASASSVNGVGSSPATSPTFVALTKAVTAEMLSSYERWADEVEIYRSGAVEKVFSSLAIPVKLKYDCPAAEKRARAADEKGPTGPRPLWQAAALVLVKVASRTIAVLEREGDALEEANVQNVWRHLLGGIQGGLLASCDFATTLSLDRQAADEDFDLVLLSTLEVDVFPHLGGPRVPSDLITSLGSSVLRASQLYDLGTAATIQEVGSESQVNSSRAATTQALGSVSTPRPRERFGFWCLDLLFLMVSDHEQSSEGSADLASWQQRVAALILPLLLARTTDVLSAYVADRALRGIKPFPRLRDEETHYLVGRLLDLRLRPGTYAGSSLAGEHGDASPTDASTTKDGIRALWHQSTRAHLFHTHRLLCDLLASESAASSGANVEGSAKGIAAKRALSAESAETLGREGRRLGVVGTTDNVLASPRLDDARSACTYELCRRALDVVGFEMGLR